MALLPGNSSKSEREIRKFVVFPEYAIKTLKFFRAFIVTFEKVLLIGLVP